MFRLEWLFLMQIVMGILMIIFLQKLTQMKKQVDEITKEVANYISFVTEDMEEVDKEQSVFVEEERIEKSLSQAGVKRKKADQENHIIQAVLGEYFP